MGAIRKLRASGFKVAALTNNWEVGEDHDERMSPLRSEFDAFVESCKVRMRKPDPRIYALICSRLNVPSEEMVFLDDADVCVTGARDAGIHAIHYQDNAQAIAEIEELLASP